MHWDENIIGFAFSNLLVKYLGPISCSNSKLNQGVLSQSSHIIMSTKEMHSWLIQTYHQTSFLTLFFTPKPNWNWSLHISLKVQLFLRCVLVNALPNGAKLNNIFHTTYLCPRCHLQEEMLLHAFGDCLEIKQVWQDLQMENIFIEGPYLSPEQWLFQYRHHKKKASNDLHPPSLVIFLFTLTI